MKWIVSSVILVCGYWGAANLGFPYSLIPLCVSAVGGYCVLTRKSREVILRFGWLTWTKEEVCRHFLITGDTGSGKTTSGFHPILLQLTKNVPDWGGLVLGVKGDEPEFIHDLLKHHGREHDQISLQVRPPDASTKWHPPHRYNLLSDRHFPWSTHAKIIVDIAASLVDGKTHAFFRPMAQIALTNGFELLDLLGEKVTLSRAYELLTSKETATKCIKPFQKKSATAKQQELVEFFESTFTRAQAFEQREAVEGTIKTYIGFFLNPDVAAVYSSDEPNTFSFSQLDQGGILTLGMPQTLATERRYMQTYLKILFFYHALSRFDKPKADRINENLLLLVADEYQDVVTAAEDGLSDHKFIDRIRAANTGIIAGMQSDISADPAISEKKREVLTLNMRSRFIFRAAEEKGATASANFIGKHMVTKKTRTSKPLGPVTISRRKEQEFYIRPSELLRLPDHTAVIAHPSKKFVKKRIAPRNSKGEIYPWY